MEKNDLSLIANTIRSLSIDGVQKANSGHPGMPMGCADIAAVLWSKIMKYNPDDPAWRNRDRFVLSPGHGSMLLYSALHLAGYDIALDDLKNFRQWESLTPGHPEYAHTPGVETTTGPLGQGFANGVGMSLASNLLGTEFNGNEKLIDHYIYAIVSDGDLMEGVAAEAASLAGHLGLGNIIYIYDSNNISIEGSTDLTYTDDVEKRFSSHNWHVQTIDGHDFDQIESAILAAQGEKSRPSLIIAKTRIAKGSPNMEGSSDTHGAPLGDEEVRKTKENIGCDPDSLFCVPKQVYEFFRKRKKDLLKEYDAWQNRSKKVLTGELKSKWDTFFDLPNISKLRENLPEFPTESPIATRKASGAVLEMLFRELPNLIGGSADLSPSNKSHIKGYSESGKNTIGRNIHFGIREHAMGAIQNGIAYYGGFIPYAATFFVFMDYMRPPMRLAALNGLQAIYIFTHDSIFVGEDGPTHQPVEHLAAARAIPNLTIIRPADAVETGEAWLAAVENIAGPTALVLTRQGLPVLERKKQDASQLHNGAYVIWESDSEPEILFLSSGSEVHLAIAAAEELDAKGKACRVISFPSWELFEKQDDDYKKGILSDSISKRIVIEAGISQGWERYAGRDALFITIEDFGASAPGSVLAEKFGLTKENVLKEVKEYLD